jgi:hypothetical protein
MKLPRLGRRYWEARLRRWPRPKAATEGYSLLVPVPGDLPVFLRLALAVCRHQRSAYRVETIVVPDRLTKDIRDLVSEARVDWPGELYLQPLPRPERWALPMLGNAGRNHAMQFISGVARSRATHVVLHDADLFLLARDQLDRQFEMCRDRRLACLGVSPAWDKWFAEHDRRLAATWELCAQVKWVRAFMPALHMAHDDEFFGEQHTFDTTFYPQVLTDQSLIGVEPSDDIVHFNYVISNYRGFTRRSGDSWLDRRFLLLLTSVFVELFDHERWRVYRLPSLSELADCVGEKTGPIRFPEAEAGAEDYRRFRALLGRALTGPWVADVQRDLAVDALAPFDRFYGLLHG